MVGSGRLSRQAAFVADRLEKRFVAGVPGCRAQVVALQGASLVVGRGEVVVLVGRAGAGKTTLLLCAAGLMRPDSGALCWFGAGVPDATRTSYVRTVGDARRRLARDRAGLLLVDVALESMKHDEHDEAVRLARDAAECGTAVLLASRAAPTFGDPAWRSVVLEHGVIREESAEPREVRTSSGRVAEGRLEIG